MPRIAVIPGDGIGIDVTVEVLKLIDVLNKHTGVSLDLEEFDYGADKYLETGVTLPDEAVADFRENFDAIYLGALGDPRVPDMAHAKDILLGLRFKLDLYINFRPVKLLDERLCPLRDKGPEDVNFVVFRENTEGIYVGMGGNFKEGTPDEVAIQESLNTRKGVERIIRHAFEYVEANRLGKLVMSNKSNAMRFEGDLWDRVFEEVGSEFPNIEQQHLYIDALTMQMVKLPEQFDAIVTSNMFGDIVTDLGAQIQGGMGLAASANVHPGITSMFEPVHGSAPKYHGMNVANPLAAILTLQLMLEHLGFPEEGACVEKAVKNAINEDRTTRDLGGNLGTKEVGDGVAADLVSMLKG